MRARIRGTELYFDIDGSGLTPEGDRMVERPTLFLHTGGPGGDHTVFKPSYTPLRDLAQLVYFDPRGCGRSAPCDPSEITLDNHIDDLDALRDHLGLERISLLGGSYGGMVALGYALRYPQRLANLILVATAPSYRFLEDARRIIRARGTPEQIAICERLWNGNFESLEQLREYYWLLAPLYSLTFDPTKFDDGWKRSIRSYVALNRGFGDFLRTFDFTERLHEIRCPTLILAGAHDWICPPNHSRLMAERIPRSLLKIFPRSSHSIAADEPAALLLAISGFLTHATDLAAAHHGTPPAP
jgi:proline iminopeptidase